MAKYDTAKKKRDSAERKRAAAQKIIDDPKKSAAQKAAARQRRDANAKTMREQGNIMRGVTGREKGERTVYTGPLTEKGREDRGLPDMTKWQTANVGLLGALGGDRALLRQQFTPEMQAEYMRTGRIPEGFVPPKTTRTRTGTATGTATGTGGGLLGGYGYGGYGGYPVLSMGTPSGASYPAAAEAAEGYAGALGFNIGPEGGLVYRPWEAQAWKQAGIDPNLWNAPFAGGGFLGGRPTVVRTGGAGTDRTRTGTGGPMPDGTTPDGTTADSREEWLKTLPTAKKDWWPNGATNDQMAEWMNRTGGTPLEWTRSLPDLFGRRTAQADIPPGTGTGRSATWGGVPIYQQQQQAATPLQEKAAFMANPPIAGYGESIGALAPQVWPNTAPPGFGTAPQLYMDDLARMQGEAAAASLEFPPVTNRSAVIPQIGPTWAGTNQIGVAPRRTPVQVDMGTGRAPPIPTVIDAGDLSGQRIWGGYGESIGLLPDVRPGANMARGTNLPGSPSMAVTYGPRGSWR